MLAVGEALLLLAVGEALLLLAVGEALLLLAAGEALLLLAAGEALLLLEAFEPALLLAVEDLLEAFFIILVYETGTHEASIIKEPLRVCVCYRLSNRRSRYHEINWTHS